MRSVAPDATAVARKRDSPDGDARRAAWLSCVQGEGGVNVLDRDYIRFAERLCRERDILLITDEVQTGNGRTGTLFAYEQYGIIPDILTTAKGLGGGLPIGATLMGAKVADTLTRVHSRLSPSAATRYAPREH